MTKVRTFSSNNGLVEERRKQIIEAAMRLICTNGLQKTSIREIAKASGMTIGNLYHYIGERNDIIYLAFNDGVERYMDLLKEINNRCRDLPAQEALVWAIDRYYRYHHDTRLSTVFIFKEMSSFTPAFADPLLRASAQTQETFLKILNRGVNEGIFSPHNLDLAADTIQTMGEMWAVKRYTYKTRFTLEEYIQRATELALKLVSI